MKSRSGFTIVELLIVIVVIAILAAITIVAYNGIQNRAKTSAGQELATTVAKKTQIFYTLNGVYPRVCELQTNRIGSSGNPCSAGTGSAGDEAKISDPSSVTFSGDATGSDFTTASSNDNKRVGYYLCGTSTGANVYYIDFSNGSVVATAKAGAGC